MKSFTQRRTIFSAGAFGAGLLALSGISALLLLPRFGAQARRGAVVRQNTAPLRLTAIPFTELDFKNRHTDTNGHPTYFAARCTLTNTSQSPQLLYTQGMQEWLNFQTNTKKVFVPELFGKSLSRGRVLLQTGETFKYVIPLSTRGATKAGQTFWFRVGFCQSRVPCDNAVWSDPISVKVRKEWLADQAGY